MPIEDLGRYFSIDGSTLLTMFWFAAVLEVPRFMIAAFYLGGREVFGRSPQFPSRIPRVPSISVLLPGHNEGAVLERAIRALSEQICAPAQIVVVDDGSTDNMASIGHKLKAEGLIDVIVSTGLRSGKASANNLGLNFCTGDLVVVADIDTSFDRDALVRLAEPFADPRVGAVSGNLGVRNFDASMVTRCQAVQYLSSISMGRRVNDMLFGLFIASGAFAAFRREALNTIGGWTAGPAEDGDITTRMRRAGWKVRFQPDAWALTDVPETLTGLLRQRARWNRSFTMLRFRKHVQILNPFRSNFSLNDAVGLIDSVYFEICRPAAYLVYFAWLFVTFGALAWPIMALVFAIYLAANTALFAVAIAASAHYGRISLLSYVPAAVLLNALVLRPATVYASLSELLWRRGYRDNFVPARVRAAIDWF